MQLFSLFRFLNSSAPPFVLAFDTLGSPVRLTNRLGVRLNFRVRGVELHICMTKSFARALFILIFAYSFRAWATDSQSKVSSTEGSAIVKVARQSGIPHPAVHVPRISHRPTLDPSLCVHIPGTTKCDPNTTSLLRRPDIFTNDGEQFFIKISYLFHW